MILCSGEISSKAKDFGADFTGHVIGWSKATSKSPNLGQSTKRDRNDGLNV